MILPSNQNKYALPDVIKLNTYDVHVHIYIYIYICINPVDIFAVSFRVYTSFLEQKGTSNPIMISSPCEIQINHNITCIYPKWSKSSRLFHIISLNYCKAIAHSPTTLLYVIHNTITAFPWPTFHQIRECMYKQTPPAH